jgi:ATP-binding cassette, subfamily B, multidrug efflux pump
MQSAMASLERIFSLFDQNTEDEAKTESRDLPAGVKGEIQFKGVHFHYSPDHWVLKDLSFTIQPGEVVAIVGMTGAGKSTLIQLLEGFYKPQKGVILIDGLDIQRFPKNILRSLIGLVPQETFLFTGNLLENILLPDQAISPEDRKRILEGLPLGWPLEKLEARSAEALSAGEQQLIALARVMVRKPAILILDEATSQIDAESEALVQESIKRLLAGRTALIVAHRLFTLRQATRIMVIHDGRLVEDGTHGALMEKQGYYYRLYQLQYNNKVTGDE